VTVQPFTPHELAVAGPDAMPLGVRNIVAWAGALNAAASLVERLIDTPFVPISFWPLPQNVNARDFPNPAMKHPRESPEEFAWRRQTACASASAAVLYGGQVGYDPLVALASIFVVRGRPGMYAEAMLALVKGAGHEIVLEDITDSRCAMRGRRKGEESWQRFTFTMERARKAGYDKQNPKYNHDPQSMLYARCASITCRSIAPDVLKGVPAVEELHDEPDGSVSVTSTRTVRRGARPSAAVEPAERPALPGDVGIAAAPSQAPPVAPAPAGPPLPGEEPPAGGGLDEKTWRAINARLNEIGVSGAGQQGARLIVIRRIVGRQDVERGSDLTREQGQLVIDTLAGESGINAVWDAIGGDGPGAFPFVGELGERLAQPEATPGAEKAAEDAEPDGEESLPDPTTEDGWGKDDGAPPLPGDEPGGGAAR
jgi:hypothetical protein